MTAAMLPTPAYRATPRSRSTAIISTPAPRVARSAPGAGVAGNLCPRRAARGAERAVDVLDDPPGRQLVFALKRRDRLAGCIVRRAAMPESVRQHHREPIVTLPPVPVVAADLFP